MSRLRQVQWQEFTEAPRAEPLPPLPAPVPDAAGGRLSRAALKALVRRVQERAYRRGREDGERETSVRLRAEIEQQVAAFARRYEEFLVDYKALMAAFEASLVDLALAIAERILAREVQGDPAWVLPILRQALGEGRQCPVRAWLHPEDVERLRAWTETELSAVQLLPDPGLQRGDLILETPSGRYDLRIASQLRRLAERLRAEVSVQ